MQWQYQGRLKLLVHFHRISRSHGSFQSPRGVELCSDLTLATASSALEIRKVHSQETNKVSLSYSTPVSLTQDNSRMYIRSSVYKQDAHHFYL